VSRKKLTPNGVKSKDPFDPGTGPAPPVSRNDLAGKTDEQRQIQAYPIRPSASPAVVERLRGTLLDPVDDEEAAENEIEREYQGMLLGVRRLPRSQRPAARRAAREWRQMMLAALREKRRRERRAKRAQGQLQRPAPR
jgi:hypothetical protein